MDSFLMSKAGICWTSCVVLMSSRYDSFANGTGQLFML